MTSSFVPEYYFCFGEHWHGSSVSHIYGLPMASFYIKGILFNSYYQVITKNTIRLAQAAVKDRHGNIEDVYSWFSRSRSTLCGQDTHTGIV